jgi:hypothetical protein
MGLGDNLQPSFFRDRRYRRRAERKWDQLKDSMRSKKKGRGVDNTMSRVGR